MTSLMMPPVKEIIEEIVQGCATDADKYRRYMERTSWRIESDFRFLVQALPDAHTILDVGSTPPLLAALLVFQSNRQLTVMDPSIDHFAQYCRDRNILALQQDLLLPHEDTTFRAYDLVCLCEVLEHLTGDLLGVLQRVGSWVRPGGHLYITTPNLRSITGAVSVFVRGSGIPSKSREAITKQYTRAQSPHGYFGHVREYTPKEVADLVAPFGFSLVAQRFQVHPRAETPGAKIIQIAERLIPPWRLYGKYLFQKKP